mgnify:FL=1|tara:strand:+ start:799 stop:1134 length:336 start_codon:yes stop_codon:yes gene_type:complete
MITEKIKWGNYIHTDGTVSKKYIYSCETVEEFLALLHKLEKEDKKHTAIISEREITYEIYVRYLDTSKLSLQSKLQEIIENTELVFDDGITDEDWERAEKAIDEIHGSEEE